ncbi:hypothetical protein Plhal710r2_c075g0178881 [Plasmopara halstedii]
MDYLVVDLEEVDYNSDTPFLTPCPFPDLPHSDGSGIIANHFDETQMQQPDAVSRAALMRAHPRSFLDPRVGCGFARRIPPQKRTTRSLDHWASTRSSPRPIHKRSLKNKKLSVLATWYLIKPRWIRTTLSFVL